MEKIAVSPTLIWYYHICKREVWLMAHQIVPDQDNTNINIGRTIAEHSYSRQRKEIRVGSAVIDVWEKDGDEFVISEVKKSSRFKESARWQLTYYLYLLKTEAGIDARGQLRFPEEKKTESVKLTDEACKQIEEICAEIQKIIGHDRPPALEKTKYCRKCGYFEYCWV